MSSSSVSRVCLVACVMWSGVVIALAQNKPNGGDAAASPVPQPAPELAGFMKELLGRWRCVATFSPGAFGPGSPQVQGAVTIKLSQDPALGGFFYRGDYSLAKSKELPMAMNGIFFLGYDSALGLAISVSVDSMGAASMGAGALSETSLTTSGESYMMGKKVKIREVITKTAEKQLAHTFEVDSGMGFQKVGEDVCKR